MENTILLAQMWGPTILAIGLGIFISRKYYIKLYRDLQTQSMALLLFAMVAIPAGIAQIYFHNIWETFPEIVISLLGWGLFLKGLIFALAPGLVDKAGDWEADSKLVPFAGALMVVLGVYLTWFGFFM